MKNLVWSTSHELILNDIVKACNCELSDSAGNKYIDMESEVWCTNVGHCNPKINSVMSSQLKKVIHTGFNYCYPALTKTEKDNDGFLFNLNKVITDLNAQ